MRIGVISEGKADFAVIRSIIRGTLSIESFDIRSLRPDLQTDETSLHAPDEKQFSNWEIVKRECVEQSTIKTYLDSGIEGACFVVIHIDAAECDLLNFGVVRPERSSPTYVAECYQAVAQKLDAWLAGCDLSLIVKAIAVEETDAWLLPLYDAESLKKIPDTGNIANPKEKLEKALNRSNVFSEKERKKLFNKDTLSKYAELSTELRKPKALLAVMRSNASLRLFVESLCNNAKALEPEVCRIEL